MARKKKERNFRELFCELMSTPIENVEGLPPELMEKEGITLQEAIAIMVSRRAVNGDLSAVKFLREMVDSDESKDSTPETLEVKIKVVE